MKTISQRPVMIGVVLLVMSLGVASRALGQLGTPGVARMLNTKHNLSASGPGPLRAESENQLCVFCHTPHVPSGYTANQLWNHKLTNATYELYSSDYLTNLNYVAPNQPNQRSRLCLSCHDGTIAIGAVYNNGGDSTTIQMKNNVVTMPPGAPGFLGTSLANDHPVGYAYDNNRDPELAGRQWPWNTPVKLDPDLATGTVECQTCHDPHDNTFRKFLKVSNTNAALCTFCHVKTGWADAAHKTSTQSYTPPGEAGTTVGEWSCRSCHQSHNGPGVPYLLRGVEENTCYASGCHSGTAPGTNTKDIESEMTKAYAHPTNTVQGKHKNPDTGASLDASSRHAECQDCHNSHQSKKGLHATGTNIVSNSLLGTSGVIPGFTPIWTQPSSYTQVKPTVQENQICLKCHSSNAFGIVANGVTSILTPSGINSTDQAMEFNVANHSAHPVVTSSSTQTGSPLPRPLTAAQMTADWSTVGTQTMYCSDCHGNDQPTSATVPQGPHGANTKFMLTGTAKYWPESAFGTLWSLGDIKNNTKNWQTDLFCVNCHPMVSGGNFVNIVHDKSEHQGASVRCITCHVAVPHGAKRSRLIGYSSDVFPYNFLGAGTYDKLVINGFQKANSPNGYAKENCSMTGVCHGTQVGVYEP